MEWMDKKEEDSCWFYPEIFGKIAEVVEIEIKVSEPKMTREQFEAGCDHYMNEYVFRGNVKGLL